MEVGVDEVDVVGQPADREYEGHSPEHLYNLNTGEDTLCSVKNTFLHHCEHKSQAKHFNINRRN